MEEGTSCRNRMVGLWPQNCGHRVLRPVWVGQQPHRNAMGQDFQIPESATIRSSAEGAFN